MIVRDRNIPAIVLGGGISGLTAARILQDSEQEYLLLERCPTLGGLTRTVEVGEFCFDYTGHFLHLCRYPSPQAIPYANLIDEEWTQVNRKSFCYVGGKLITAPIQYNLAELPADLFGACVESYNRRPSPHNGGISNFRDYMISGFGQALSDLFLIPQNEKTMAIGLESLSAQAVRRFFPVPDEKLVRRGMVADQKDKVDSYNSTFWYPKIGGVQRLVDGLKLGLRDCAVNRDIIEVDLKRKAIRTARQEVFHWSSMFSSIPLKSFCEMTNDDDLRCAAAELSYSATISFNIGLRTPLAAELEAIHWIYVPDRTVPFYRVGFYSNIGTGMVTPGNSGLYVEVGMQPNELDVTNIARDLQPKVISSLEELGWIDSQAITCIVTHVINCAYIHHTPERDRALSVILPRLREASVFPIGRYGLWDYISMEDSMESARVAAMEVVQ
jgi:protoporphyrinogen oxidase